MAVEQSMHALHRLEKAMEAAVQDLQRGQVGGRITEVTPSHYCVSGLSRFLKLGECVSFAVDGRTEIGEVVRLDASRAIVKPFAPKLDTRPRTVPSILRRLSSSPHQTPKG